MRPRHALSTAAILAATSASAAMLGGCGGSGGAGSVIDPVAKAATVSNSAPGMRMNFVMHLSTAALPTPIVATGNGSFDTPDHSGSLTMAMNFGNLPQVTQVLGSSTLRMQAIINGLIFYIKFPPALTRMLPLHGKSWLKINLANATQAAGIPGVSSLLSNPASADPSQFLRYLRATSGGVTKVGTQTVDGSPTTHYQARIELDRVPNSFPPASRPQVRQTIASLERLAHIHSMPVNVWIDHQHLVRRMQFSLKETISGQSLRMTMRIDVPQYGPQSPPQLPPASQVADLSGSAAGA